MRNNRAFFIALLYITSFSCISQELIYRDRNTGFNLGGVFAVGTHVNRLGLVFNFFYQEDLFQANSELRFYFNFKNLGPKQQHAELMFGQGVVFGYGPRERLMNPFLSTVGNQTGYRHSVGYSYNFWFNKVKTTQQTGVIALQFDDYTFITENDLLARPLLDRFRTGAFLIQYQHDTTAQVAFNCAMWTGKMGKAVRDVQGFPGPGYIDTSGGVYTNHSHGILSLNVKYHFAGSQILQMNMGADAEQVRNAVQNKIIHDACFLPKSWFKRYNCHIPMLDTAGNQYLYKPEQKIRKPKPYWELMVNGGLFY